VPSTKESFLLSRITSCGHSEGGSGLLRQEQNVRWGKQAYKHFESV